jgi:hypothetical protein
MFAVNGLFNSKSRSNENRLSEAGNEPGGMGFGSYLESSLNRFSSLRDGNAFEYVVESSGGSNREKFFNITDIVM